MMLDGFKIVNLVTGVPYMSVTKNGVSFNKPCVIKMNYPTHVKLLINYDKKLIAIQTCNENDEDAILFLRNKNTKLLNVRWNNKDLLNQISKIMDWDINTMGYRIDGENIEAEKAMIFDLNQATLIEN